MRIFCTTWIFWPWHPNIVVVSQCATFYLNVASSKSFSTSFARRTLKRFIEHGKCVSILLRVMATSTTGRKWSYHFQQGRHCEQINMYHFMDKRILKCFTMASQTWLYCTKSLFLKYLTLLLTNLSDGIKDNSYSPTFCFFVTSWEIYETAKWIMGILFWFPPFFWV